MGLGYVTYEMNSKRKHFSISELSEEFGVTPRTLRFYEDRNLISPAREGQTRIYSSADRARLAWILRGKRVGFTLTDIGEVLDMYYDEGGRYKQSKITLEACNKRISQLEAQRQDIDETIKDLREMVQAIEDWIETQTPKDNG